MKGSDVLFGALVLLGIGGYIANIVKLFDADGGGEIAVRVIGIIAAPLGAIVGFF